jgi:hypothetical protein
VARGAVLIGGRSSAVPTIRPSNVSGAPGQKRSPFPGRSCARQPYIAGGGVASPGYGSPARVTLVNAPDGGPATRSAHTTAFARSTAIARHGEAEPSFRIPVGASGAGSRVRAVFGKM